MNISDQLKKLAEKLDKQEKTIDRIIDSIRDQTKELIKVGIELEKLKDSQK